MSVEFEKRSGQLRMSNQFREKWKISFRFLTEKLAENFFG